MTNTEQALATIASDVKDIELSVGDPEAAHVLEDRLWERVLFAIARGTPDPDRLANAALETILLKFPRWKA